MHDDDDDAIDMKVVVDTADAAEELVAAVNVVEIADFDIADSDDVDVAVAHDAGDNVKPLQTHVELEPLGLVLQE